MGRLKTMTQIWKHLLTICLCLWLALPSNAVADPLAAPTGDVILEIGGAIAKSNGPSGASFDLGMLDALPQRETRTTTPWYDGAHVFSGPTVKDLLGSVAAEGARLRVTAINDYAVEMPIADLVSHPVILASRLDGELMSIRDKGPLFIIYPFDEVPELVNEMSFSRSVWQVRQIEVLP